MKKILIVFFMFIFTASIGFCACSIKELETGCSANISNDLSIPSKESLPSNNYNQNENKQDFTAPKNNSKPVLEKASPSPQASKPTYDTNCQFGMCKRKDSKPNRR